MHSPRERFDRVMKKCQAAAVRDDSSVIVVVVVVVVYLFRVSVYPDNRLLVTATILLGKLSADR